MNIILWVLQVALAIHTAIGAFWKFSNSTEMVPSLKAMPNSVWMSLIGIELLCAAGLVLPAINRQWGMLVPLAAIVIALEMVLFTILHLRSGQTTHGEIVYWLCVAAICLVIAYGRSVVAPLGAAA